MTSEVGLGQAGEHARVGAVAAGDVQLVEEPRGPHAVGGVAGAAGALGEGLGEPGLADAGGADQEQVAMLGDPGAGGRGSGPARLSRPRRGLCQSMSSSEAWRRRLAVPQAPAQLALLAVGPLGVDEQAEAVLEAELGELGIAELALEGLGHGRAGAGRSVCRRWRE